MTKSRGFTLVELLIAMTLGLVIVGSVMAVMVANKRSYRSNEGLSQVQESTRTAYELIAHDVRQADGNGCGSSTRTANLLTAGTLWWQNWFGMTGYDQTQVDPAVPIGTGPGQRVAGTDSIRVESMDSAGLSVALHVPASFRLDIATAHDFGVGDIMVVCDSDHATIFQASGVTGTTSVFHNTGVVIPGTPGNCGTGLGFPTICAGVGNVYEFRRNSQIGRLAAVDWYIGNNGRAGEGGRSLYRRRLGLAGTVLEEEVVAGITDMQMRFRATGSNDIIEAPAVADWSTISSVLIRITAESSDINVTAAAPGANTGRVLRQFNYLISLRNRLP